MLSVAPGHWIRMLSRQWSSPQREGIGCLRRPGPAAGRGNPLPHRLPLAAARAAAAARAVSGPGSPRLRCGRRTPPGLFHRQMGSSNWPSPTLGSLPVTDSGQDKRGPERSAACVPAAGLARWRNGRIKSSLAKRTQSIRCPVSCRGGEGYTSDEVVYDRWWRITRPVCRRPASGTQSPGRREVCSSGLSRTRVAL
jgi:hypothetical protein